MNIIFRNALVIQAPTTLVLQMLYISSLYITSLRFRRFMMKKKLTRVIFLEHLVLYLP